jgi:DNA mismatch endonuclease Vsr
MDRLSPKQRSANMRAVRRSDTAPEMAVRRLLHRAGYRYRFHNAALPGRPDIDLQAPTQGYIRPRLCLAWPRVS